LGRRWLLVFSSFSWLADLLFYYWWLHFGGYCQPISKAGRFDEEPERNFNQ
jgi:hypothetical protein